MEKYIIELSNEECVGMQNMISRELEITSLPQSRKILAELQEKFMNPESARDYIEHVTQL